MNGMKLLGILATIYAVMVIVIAVKKPKKIWNMYKIEIFKKIFGEQGTVIFFLIWGLFFAVLGFWLLVS